MSSPKANRIRLKVPHTNFLTGQFNAHDKDCETGWNPKAQKPQIEMYYRTLMEDDENTPTFQRTLLPLVEASPLSNPGVKPPRSFLHLVVLRRFVSFERPKPSPGRGRV